MQFNHNLETYNRKAAEIIAPLIFDRFHPTSVLDIGCGIGTWLSVFRDLGVQTIVGVDGDWVDRSLLRPFISQDCFIPYDLRQELNLYKNFDVVLSLEVAEHLAEECADVFVKSLVNHGDVIVFSAAVPSQEGENHVNEQWPSYWIEKFAKHQLFPDNGLRSQIWSNKNLEFWYKQNILVFTKQQTDCTVFDVVHPEPYMHKIRALNTKIADYEQGRVSLIQYLVPLAKKIIRKLKSYARKRPT